MSDNDSVVKALLAAIAVENAAVYGYSTAGAKLAMRDKNAARIAYDAHRAQVETVTQWLATLNATPAPATPVYQLPSAITDTEAARALLAAIEESVAAAYADVVAVASSQIQHDAALELQAAAIREAQWRTTSVPFPGLVGRLSP